ncbi:MAG: NCS2 family permease [Planctomycetota bacterium]|jgi:AGZA family xanthine/uracil permease-like MFS transporter
MDFVERMFRVTERGSTVRREVLGGVTTFMALSYIIFVQPAIMEAAGVPRAGAFVATCVASAVACVLMGLLANYPIALAPAMGHNVFFAFAVCLPVAQGGFGMTWQQALTAVFIGGCVFVALSSVGFRAKMMEFIPDSLKRGIAGGIGLLITFIGLEYAGVVVGAQATGIKFGNVLEPATLLSLFGLLLMLVLLALGVRGAVLFGIVATTALGVVLTLAGTPVLSLEVAGLGALDPGPSFLAFDFAGLLNARGALTVILTFLFLDVFDTVGTLIGVSDRAGLLDEGGRLPRAQWALFSDAAGTVVGAAMGTSTITSYVESAAGVQAGARTGLANLATAALFLLSIVAYPVLGIVASSHLYTEGGFSIAQYPVLAPALIVVGSMMLKSLARLDWDDATEFLPAFLTVVVMPLAISITEGIAFGFISYSVLKVATGRRRDVHWAFHLVSLVLVLRYVFLGPGG